MSDTGFLIQQLDHSNYSLLVPLMKDCFGMEVSNDYFKWKYFDNPAGRCVGFIAVEGKTNKGISFYGAMPQTYRIDDRETIIYQACDTMTDTQYRKKGLYPILARECYEYLKKQNLFFMIGIGGTVQSFPVLKHFGWRVIFHFRSYFKPNIFCNFYFFKKYATDRFVEEDSLDPLKDLITDQAPSSAILSPRNLAHYKWRISNPNFHYRIVSCKEKNSKRGFIVFYVQNNKIVLFDFKFTNRTAQKMLLWYLSGIVVKNNYKGIVSFCQENGIQSRQLKKSFFISNPFKKGPLPEKPPFLIYADETTMAKYADPGKWCITAYDYDAI